MGRYDNDYDSSPVAARQRDLVLSINEFCFLQNKTNGTIKSHVGPLTMTISQQEALVTFDARTKKFVETSDFEKAKQLFISAPEGWYVILKNPAADGQHPDANKANTTPENIKIGTKVNIPGPTSFALYPGQMAKVVRGHKLRSNQYLIARVYDAAAAKEGMSSATIVDTEGKEIENKENEYFVGQLLVIKGTEVSFYMPPTGIEVIPQTTYGDDYVRDAITLERLEYAILKDEDGEKRYVHGPAVVFPKPTETFVTSAKGSPIFRALELSPISGIYVKVIAEYEENGVKHPIGEELFITGNEQMIYYPRPEHAMIQYDGKYMHHAIAIPAGEGRYILNRLTGDIKTVKGPQMYLPDPRKEVVVKRKLTEQQCRLWYPGNEEALAFNRGLSEKDMTRKANRGELKNVNDIINQAYSTSNQEDTLAIFEANANISRGVSYTKPRTICLDTKYDGAVGISVWTGYAVNVVSKSGKREVLCGPTTRLLDYDESLEVLELSTGKPKTTDYLLKTVYLRTENNKISDVINVQTKDFVDVQIKVSYCVDFLKDYKDKWFNVENYIKFLTDRCRSLMKREAKKHNIQDFYQNATDITRNVILNISENKSAADKPSTTGRLFKENGMMIKDVEVLSVGVESSVAKILNDHQSEIIKKNLELSDAEARAAVVKKLAEYDRQEAQLKNEEEMYRIELKNKETQARIDAEAAEQAKRAEVTKAQKTAIKDLQPILNEVLDAELARDKARSEEQIRHEKEIANIEKAKQAAYAETVKKIMASISPDLVAALNAQANASMLENVTEAVAPYAIAKDESISDFTNKMLRGTSIEGIIDNFSKKSEE